MEIVKVGAMRPCHALVHHPIQQQLYTSNPHPTDNTLSFSVHLIATGRTGSSELQGFRFPLWPTQRV